MSRYADFQARVEAEAKAEGSQAVAELRAYREYYRLARQLAGRRRELGWSQTRLSSLTGVQQSEISRIEQGRANPTFLTLSRLTSALGMALRLERGDDGAAGCRGDAATRRAALSSAVVPRGAQHSRGRSR